MGLGWVWACLAGLSDLEIPRVGKVWLRAGPGLVWVGLGAGRA